VPDAGLDVGNTRLVCRMKIRLTATIALAGVGLMLVLPEAARSQTDAPGPVSAVRSGGRVTLTNLGGSMSGTSTFPEPAHAESGATNPENSRRPPAYAAIIDDISTRHGVDPRLTRAIIEIESAFDPNAVSSKGALGLMQLIPATGERFGVNNFFDPADNISGGVKFLRFLIDKFDGNADLVLAAYNSGENRVARLGRIPAIPETLEYVRKVRFAFERMGGTLLDLAGLRAGSALPPGPTVLRTVDERGMLRFSSVGPNR